MPKVPYEAALNRQQIAVAIVRAASVLCVLAGIVQVAQWLIESASAGNLGDFGTYAPPIAKGAMLLLGGAAGAVWSRQITRLLLGRPAMDLCPGCDYQLSGTPDRCPECGLEFASAVAPADRVSAHDALVRRRHLLRALIRLAVLYILIITIWHFGSGAAWVFVSLELAEYETLPVVYLVSVTLSLAAGLGLAGLVRLAERRLILWMTPVGEAESDEPPGPDEPPPAA